MFPCCCLHSSTLSFPNWAHKPVHCICLSVPALCIQMTFDLRIHRPRLLASVQDSSKGGRSPLWHLHGSLVPLFATCLFHCPSPSTQGVILKYPPINFCIYKPMLPRLFLGEPTSESETLGHWLWLICYRTESLFFSSVQSLSCVRLFTTPWTTTYQASLSITNSQSPPKPMSIESVMPSNHLILCHPLLLLPSIFPSIGVFSNESALDIR